MFHVKHGSSPSPHAVVANIAPPPAPYTHFCPMFHVKHGAERRRTVECYFVKPGSPISPRMRLRSATVAKSIVI